MSRIFARISLSLILLLLLGRHHNFCQADIGLSNQILRILVIVVVHLEAQIKILCKVEPDAEGLGPDGVQVVVDDLSFANQMPRSMLDIGVSLVEPAHGIRN